MEEFDLNSKPGQNDGGRKLEANTKKRPIVPLFIVGAVVLIALSLALSFLRDKKNTINLEECVMSPVYEGMNGEAKVVEVKLDQTALENKIREINPDAYIDFYDLESRVTFSYDVNQTNIKNGDEVLITINYDKNEMKNAFGFNFTGTEKTFIASTLFDYVDTNVFEDLSFIFEGVAPVATLSDFVISNDSFKSFRDGYTFKLNGEEYTRDSRIDIGDTLSIELTDEGVNKLKEMGLVPSEMSLSHVIDESDVDWYVRSAADIQSDIMDKLIAQGNDICLANFANRDISSTPSFVKAYYMMPKEEKFRDRILPYVLLVYSFQNDNGETRYTSLRTPSIINQKIARGAEVSTSKQTFNVDNFDSVDYHNDLDSLFRDCVQKNVADYTYEEISH